MLHGVVVINGDKRRIRIPYTICVFTMVMTFEDLPEDFCLPDLEKVLRRYYHAINGIIRVDITLPHLHYNYDAGDDDDKLS